MKASISEIGNLETGGHSFSLQLIRSARRKRTVSFELKAPATLLITAPLRSNIDAIRRLIEARTSWITHRVAQLQKKHPLKAVQAFVNGATITYLGQHYHLSITHDLDQPQGCQIRPRRITVNMHNDQMSPLDLQREVRLEMMLWLKKRAKIKMQKRIDFWATKTGIAYERLVLSSPQRRWGSCSVHNVIRLNWRLIMAPLAILDYVIVHELCHVRHKNHLRRFWQCVESILPDYEARRQQLRQIEDQLVFENVS